MSRRRKSQEQAQLSGRSTRCVTAAATGIISIFACLANTRRCIESPRRVSSSVSSRHVNARRQSTLSNGVLPEKVTYGRQQPLFGSWAVFDAGESPKKRLSCHFLLILLDARVGALKKSTSPVAARRAAQRLPTAVSFKPCCRHLSPNAGKTKALHYGYWHAATLRRLGTFMLRRTAKSITQMPPMPERRRLMPLEMSGEEVLHLGFP